MTDRYGALTIVLDHDYRDDDAESIINAIKMIKGVASVTPHVTDVGEHVARQRFRIEMQEKLFKVISEELKG